MKPWVTKLSTNTSQNRKIREALSYSSEYHVLLYNSNHCLIPTAANSEKTRLQHCISALFPNAGNIDRLQKARQHGCNVASSSTLDGLIEILDKWGANGSQTRRTIDQYDKVMRGGNTSISLDAPAGRTGTPPVPLVDGEGPFYAMEVQPSSVLHLFTA